jgi:hypothetical protein
MQQNEQLTANTRTSEQSGVSNATTAGQTVAVSTPQNSADTAAASEEKSVVRFPQATIKIEGQEFELEAALAQDDKLLKTILQPHFASVENANITRDVKEGKLCVTIVKKAQHKG